MEFSGSVTKRFYIVGDGDVKAVGFRPSLVVEGFDRRLKLFVRNVPGERKVEVVVNGSIEDITSFWRFVREVNLRTVKEGSYRVTELEDYTGPPVDWTYAVSVLVLEQVAKGIPILASINDRLESMEGSLKNMEKSLGSVEKSLEALPVKIAEELKKMLKSS
jgi:acylphosphatase